ncbi:hypothetical protein INT45_004311, partial [Circinella minor]
MVNNIIEKVDVLISGAGPTGLYFALRMAAMGHTFKIVEARESATTETRALGVHPRTLETLQHRKLVNTMLKRAFVVQGTRIMLKGELVAEMSMEGDTVYPYLTCIPQSETENGFIDELGYENITWHTQLVSYKQEKEGVEALIKDLHTGKEEVVHARYIIGADGTHSAVRKLDPTWTYEGYSVGTKFAVGDVYLSGKDIENLDPFRANIFLHSDGIVGGIPLGTDDQNKHLYRVFGNLGPYEVTHEKKSTHGINHDSTLTLEELQKLINIRAAPLEIKITEPQDLGIFHINERKANGFRRNSAFVIGDAAHCHSPAGGQGMNLGLQDADNLSWKLSMVLNGSSSDPEKLLDSYNLEREPIDAATMKATGVASKYMFGSGVILCKFILPYVLSFPRITKPIYSSLMQLNTRIPKNSPILFQSTTTTVSATGLIEPGEFLRETIPLRKRLIKDDIEHITLHHLLQNPLSQYTIMWISSRASRYPASDLTKDFWIKFNNTFGTTTSVVKSLIIESAHHTRKHKLPNYVTYQDYYENSFWLEDHCDEPKSVSNRVGLDKVIENNKDGVPPAAIVILRPDLYVAYSGL